MQAVILNNETWLICGGRKFADQAMFDDVMHQLIGMWGCPAKVVHGDAPGADKMAGTWGKKFSIEVVPVPADWDKHGNAAGPIRNEDMLIKHKPKRVIAFPGRNGTADMVQRAKNRRGEIDVIEIKSDAPVA
ncbi:MAG: SLOG family protein [Sulfuricaulis sp.]|nr:SLOG family protein [Sulfuricaulis sp.]